MGSESQSAIGNVGISFPKFDMHHAHCALMTTVTHDCKSAYDYMSKDLVQFRDPGNGKYEEFNSVADKSLWYTRETPKKHYIDDVEWLFTDNSAGGCEISGRSRSRTESIYDYDTNFCNIWNPLRLSPLLVPFANIDTVTWECPFHPDASKANFTCDTY